MSKGIKEFEIKLSVALRREGNSGKKPRKGIVQLAFAADSSGGSSETLQVPLCLLEVTVSLPKSGLKASTDKIISSWFMLVPVHTECIQLVSHRLTLLLLTGTENTAALFLL